ncbi:major facilitator superfamily domain-containing protein [Halteromyces radiatus]|uniref:major facilitator superfamily domain-containing protein n=1 Tax=Halteromyces radiatus TaxID=101107 RepID=UPI0022203E4E|nr:major facilitator superfamily domain-containing protein [Halteromyces radiatus]KAI8100186.1 major facilitator superfamily domain-containing protein [Halteromyces radiatus]
MEEDQKKKKKKTRTASFFNVVFSGFALLSDGYQSGIISFINLVLGKIYGDTIFNDTVSSRLSYSMFVGCVVGQLGFGLFVDRIGRKAGLVATTVLVILGAALSAASSGLTPDGLLWMMVIARGVLGVGVGGEYPCSSVSAGESADEVSPGNRGKLFVMVTNFVIDLGYVISAIIPVILLAIFTENNLEPVWRVSLGLGIIPPLSVLYFRLRMADSKQYRENAMKKKVPYWLIIKRYWRKLLAVSFTWFVYDFISYPNGVFSSVIINQVAAGQPMIITSAWNILLYSFYLPGCITGAYLVDKIGRRKTLTLGLISLGIVGMVIGGAFEPLSKNCFPLFVILYGVFLALAEMGPGNTMGLIAMESFPVAVRGTGYGIAAAMGKVGATVGTVAFAPMKEQLGVRGPFLVGSGIAIFTGIVAWFAFQDIGTGGLEQEDAEFREYLQDNGYDISSMGLDNGSSSNQTKITTVHQVSKDADEV